MLVCVCEHSGSSLLIFFFLSWHRLVSLDSQHALLESLIVVQGGGCVSAVGRLLKLSIRRAVSLDSASLESTCYPCECMCLLQALADSHLLQVLRNDS